MWINRAPKTRNEENKVSFRRTLQSSFPWFPSVHDIHAIRVIRGCGGAALGEKPWIQAARKIYDFVQHRLRNPFVKGEQPLSPKY
jgi:hypothetical protein